MRKYFLLATLFLTFIKLQAQDNLIKHTVDKGETITQIAQKYLVTPSDIYSLNPDVINGLKVNQVLLIPKSKHQKNQQIIKNASISKHLVLAKESLYGLAKKYNTTVENLYILNPGLKETGLKEGTEINIKKSTNSEIVNAQSSVKPDSSKIHIVAPKETKYGIATKYELTVEELEDLNSQIKNSLPIGAKLIVAKYDDLSKTIDFKDISSEKIVLTQNSSVEDYVVESKETIYSLIRKFDITEEKLIDLNPELKNGLKEGMTIKIPKLKSEISKFYKNSSNLMSNLNNSNSKELVVLLPFNISKIKNDTSQAITSRLKNDKFLNRILDFYSGTLMAIDSANAIGLNINVKIFDSQETKNSSDVGSIIQKNNLRNTDLIIGPFYQVNVEKTAKILQSNNVFVISPLSKEEGNMSSNIIHTMPSNTDMRDDIMTFLKSKNSKIIGVVDPKKQSVKKYFIENHSNVKLVNFNADGSVNLDNIKSALDKNQKNYVILESANTFMIKSVVNFLVTNLEFYDIQLVLLESNEKFESDEIISSNLAKLKMIYPSLSQVNNSVEAAIFEKKYREINKVLPNAYATRGFDVVFDAMLRLSQNKSFEESLKSDVSEQVENKFNYQDLGSKGYKNKGFYILQIEPDFSTTVLK